MRSELLEAGIRDNQSVGPDNLVVIFKFRFALAPSLQVRAMQEMEEEVVMR